jgi:hypothetical protein
VLRALMERQPQDAPHIFCLPHMRMWTKLRPGVRQFLHRAHDLFELHIYTMGDREYAAGAIGRPSCAQLGGRVSLAGPLARSLARLVWAAVLCAVEAGWAGQQA